jgi:hypothetical protein
VLIRNFISVQDSLGIGVDRYLSLRLAESIQEAANRRLGSYRRT